MDHNARERRGQLPVLFTSVAEDPNAAEVADWLRTRVALPVR